MKKCGVRLLLALVAMWATLLVAAEKPQVAKALVKNTYRKPTRECVLSLKATKGKPIKTGWVFIDGQYLDPPYQVERFGNVIRINGCQVSNPLIPWETFIRTQPSAKKVAEEADSAETAEETEEESSEAETGEKSELDEQAKTEDDGDDEGDPDAGLEALFDDEPAAEKKEASKVEAEPREKAEVRKPAKKAKKAVRKASWTFEGEFQANAQSQELVKKLDERRNAIDRNLRNGGYYFFGSKYSPVRGDSGSAGHLFGKLPGAMKTGATRGQFESALRSAGIAIFPKLLMDDLFRNRFTYTRILQRNKASKEAEKWLMLQE